MNWVKKLYFRQIALIVAFSILIIGSIPARSMAYVVGDGTVAAEGSRAADMETVQRVLESKVVSQKLSEAGLSFSEIKPRLDKLTDQDLHQFAAQVDSLFPGGDGALGTIIALLIIVILVIVILKLTDRKIIIR